MELRRASNARELPQAAAPAPGKTIGFHFCPTCGCVTYWRSLAPGKDGRRRIAVNLRLAEVLATVAHLPIHHFDGLETWFDLPRDARCVKDLWF